jgi:hypothetical protein
VNDMTFNEFKCWLDGFNESIKGAPTAEQWEKIKAKFDTVDLTFPVPNVTPSVWPVTLPALPVSPVFPWEKYPIICSSSSSSDPVTVGCGGIVNGECKGTIQCQ